MRRLILFALALAIIGCASAPKIPQGVTAPSAVAACPTYVVDGVVQSSSCAPSKKTESASCDAKDPLYVVDGVVQPSSCAPSKKTESATCDAKSPLYVVDGVVVGCTLPLGKR